MKRGWEFLINMSQQMPGNFATVRVLQEMTGPCDRIELRGAHLFAPCASPLFGEHIVRDAPNKMRRFFPFQ